MAKEATKAVLTSVIWNWDAFYTWAIKSVADKSWNGTNYLGGLNENMVALTPLSDFNDPSAKSKIEAAANKIKSGDWDVFTGIIPTNSNTTVGSEDTSLEPNTILFGMNWYYKTVVPTNQK
jgi:basic membrane protein A